MPVETVYNYHLMNVDGKMFSVTSTGFTAEILNEYQGCVLVGREVVGYRAILAD